MTEVTQVQTQAASYTITLEQGAFGMLANAWRVTVDSSCGRLRRHGVRALYSDALAAGHAAVSELDLTARKWANI